MRKIRNFLKRMSVVTVATALIMTSLPMTAWAAEEAIAEEEIIEEPAPVIEYEYDPCEIPEENAPGSENNPWKIGKYMPEAVTAWLSAGGVLTISGSGNMKNFGSNDHPWEDSKAEIHSVVINSGVTSIGESALEGCTNLAAVTIPEGVTDIRKAAFKDCSGLLSIAFPDSVKTIGICAFQNCISLEHVRIPDHVTAVEDSVFAGCTGLTGVDIPVGVTSIGLNAFMECENLTNVTIPEGVTVIKDSAFVGCTSLESIEIPWGVTEISMWLFANCSSLKSVSIPDSVTSIDKGAFSFCTDLESIELPEGLTFLDGTIFFCCTKLKSIVIPDSLTDMHDPFSECDAKLIAPVGSDAAKTLGKYGYSFRQPGAKYDLKYEYTNEEITGLILTGADEDLTAISIPNGVTAIADDALENCKKLERVEIPATVTSIGDAFYDGKKENGESDPDYKPPVFIVPFGSNAPKDLGKQGFAFRASGEKYDLRYEYSEGKNTGLTFLAADRDITTANVPEGVTSIGGNLVNENDQYAFANCEDLTSVTLPESLTTIAYSAFEGCTGLTEIDIPDGVTSIGMSAFAGCNNLSSVKLPAGLTTLKMGVFEGCSFTSIVIPEGVESIEAYAFGNCALESITIPHSVTVIDDEAFNNNPDLKDIYYLGTQAKYNALAASTHAFPEGMEVHIPELAINYANCENGTISGSAYEFEGRNVAVKVTPAAGYRAASVTYTDADGNDVTITPKNGKYAFNMPAVETTVNATFEKIPVTIPAFTGPKDLTVVYGDPSAVFSVRTKAVNDEEYDITYQWYKNTENSNQGGNLIAGATESVYNVPSDKSAGTEEYYYCKVTSTRKDNALLSESTSSAAAKLTVVKADMTKATIHLRGALTYNGNAQTPSIDYVGIRYPGVEGTFDIASSEYDITGNNKTNAGKYTLTLTAKENGNYFGSISADYTIKKKEIVPAITVNGSYSFTGFAVTPDITVKDGDRVLAATDYTYTVSKNVNAGNNAGVITVMETDSGNYDFDPAVKSFTIDPVRWNGNAEVNLLRNYMAGQEVSDEIDLTKYLPEDCGRLSYDPVDPDDYSEAFGYAEGPKIDANNILFYKLAANGDQQDTITVKAHAQNYNNAFVIKVKVRRQALGLVEKTSGNSELLRTSKTLMIGKSFTLSPKFDENIANTRVVWLSSNPGVATVTQDGKVTAIAAGITEIKAVSEHDADEVYSQCTVTVEEPVTSVALSDKNYSFGSGESVALTAQVLPYTAPQKIRWSTSDADVVTVCDESGEELSVAETIGGKITGKVYVVSSLQSVRIKARNAGNAKVTAEAVDGSGKKAACSFAVGAPVSDFSIDGAKSVRSLAVNKTLSMAVDWGGKDKKPKNTGVTWSVEKLDGSDGSSIATISQRGVLTGLKEGRIRVLAVSTANPAKFKRSPIISVYVPVKSAALNMTSGTISTAENGNALQLSVNVVSAVEGQKPTGVYLGSPVKATYALDPSYSDPANRSYDKTKDYAKCVLVNAATGKITVDRNAMEAAGFTKLSNLKVIATVKGYVNSFNKTYTCKVTVDSANPLKSMKLSKKSLSLGEGNKYALSAILSPVNPDGDRSVTWESDNPDIVSVDQKGVVTAKEYVEGNTTATIKVRTKQMVKNRRGEEEALIATCKVTVTPSVTAIGFTNALTAEDGVNRLAVGKTFSVKTAYTSSVAGKKASADLIWSSSDESVATVSSKGMIKAVGNGVVTITAKSADVKMGGEALPSVSAKFEVYTPMTKLVLDKTKLTLGTKEGTEYGKVSVSALLPVNVSDPSVEWKTNNTLVQLAAIDSEAAVSRGVFDYADETAVVLKKGQYLAIKAETPGVVTLTGIARDGSGKKVTCTVTVRGMATGLSLKTFTTNNGLAQVEPEDENLNDGKYKSTLAPGGKLRLTPVVEINDVPGASMESIEKKIYADYKKYTDTSVTYRVEEGKTGIITVDKNGKITANRDIAENETAKVIVTTADGEHTVEITITVAP